MTLRRDLPGARGEAFELLLGHRLARAQFLDLACRVVGPGLPRFPFHGNIGEPEVAPLALLHQQIIGPLLFGGVRAQDPEIGAQPGDLLAGGLGIAERSLCLARRCDLGLGLGVVGPEELERVVQGGQLGCRRRRLLRQRRMFLARGVQPGFGVARGGAKLALPPGRALGHRPGIVALGLGIADPGLGPIELILELAQAVALAEPDGGGDRRAGADGVAVPTPKRAVAADQPLALDQGVAERLAVAFLLHHAGLRKPAGEGLGRLDEIAERPRARGQPRRCVERLQGPPMGRGGGVVGRREVIAERRAERRLIARRDGERVDQWRPRIGVLDHQQLLEGRVLGP